MTTAIAATLIVSVYGTPVTIPLQTLESCLTVMLVLSKTYPEVGCQTPNGVTLRMNVCDVIDAQECQQRSKL
jgi:hypothetical protein